jgi:hypothetical protein
MSDHEEEKLSNLVDSINEEDEEDVEGITDYIGQQIDGLSDLGIPELDADSTAADLMSEGTTDPAPSLPCTAATMQCARGPCVHRWDFITRLEAQEKTIFIQRTHACCTHVKLMSLADENVFHCDRWRPAQLVWVPDSIWALIRLRVEDVWDRVLQMRGEDFSWRWWPRDIFDLVREEQIALRDAAVKKQEAADKAAKEAASPLDDATQFDAQLKDSSK